MRYIGIFTLLLVFAAGCTGADNSTTVLPPTNTAPPDDGISNPPPVKRPAKESDI